MLEWKYILEIELTELMYVVNMECEGKWGFIFLAWAAGYIVERDGEDRKRKK